MSVMCASPSAKFSKLLSSRLLLPDQLQLNAINLIEAQYQALLIGKTARSLYLHSSPGRGKTILGGLLMDAPGVRRFHFHVLMLSIHQSLHRIRMMRGTDTPVNVLASEVASSARLFFIDEVEITDVADASLLNRLHDAILKKGASFFFTSNSAPEQLYKGGLNVGIFQPSFANRVRALIRGETRFPLFDFLNSFGQGSFSRRSGGFRGLCPRFLASA